MTAPSRLRRLPGSDRVLLHASGGRVRSIAPQSDLQGDLRTGCVAKGLKIISAHEKGG